ncbi:MAG: hypothetical protein NVS3B18_15320 [Candidatus Dormibacteria bacterium]
MTAERSGTLLSRGDQSGQAFSDSVIAVAITLLVLTVTVPEPAHRETLIHALLRHWPQFAAYVTSFLTIGIIWINHHAMLTRLREVDHSILILNLILLMTIVILPFATELLARYLRDASSQRTAAAVYAGAFLLMAIAFSIFNRLLHRAHMLELELGLGERRSIYRRAATGVIPYALATALAAVSAYLTLAICAALAVFYALPVASGGSIGHSGPAGQ